MTSLRALRLRLAVLLGEGVDLEGDVDQQLDAIEEIDKANRAGQFRKFTGNDYTSR